MNMFVSGTSIVKYHDMEFERKGRPSSIPGGSFNYASDSPVLLLARSSYVLLASPFDRGRAVVMGESVVMLGIETALENGLLGVFRHDGSDQGR